MWTPRDLRLRCPSCGAHVSSIHAWGTPYQCPGCNEQLQVPASVYRRLGLIDLAIGFLAALLIGARGWDLLWAIPLGYAVAVAITFEIQVRFFPTRLEAWNPEDKHWG